MPMEEIFVQASRDPSNCCIVPNCNRLPHDGTDHCLKHGSHHYTNAVDKATVRSYMLNRWDSRMARFHGAENLKSLREEIAISRLTLEGILNRCSSEFDLLVYSVKISKMVDTIRALVVDCNRLEDKLGYTLDKGAILNLSEQLVVILANVVPEEKMVEVADQIVNAIVSQNEPIGTAIT